MKKKSLCIAVLAGLVLSLAGEEKMVADTSFPVPENWQLKVIMGKDWWPMLNLYGLTKDPASLKEKNVKRASVFTRLSLEMGIPIKPEVKEKFRSLGVEIPEPRLLPAFTQAGWIGFSPDAKPGKHGTYDVFLPHKPEFDLAKEKGVPFMMTSEKLMRGSVGKITFVTGESYTTTPEELARFREWRKAHPNFLGFKVLSEWDNNAHILDTFYTNSWWPAAVKAKKVRADQKEE
ncbi:MAG: hypothetical protein J6A21_09255 [Lentisphaeria bacterium]|nr:hypothetical protein [Lentisphaeria bacterium]